jgi:hypothetical protein
VIKEFHAAIGHRQFGPCRAEGFAAIVTLNPAAGEATPGCLKWPGATGAAGRQHMNAIETEGCPKMGRARKALENTAAVGE